MADQTPSPTLPLDTSVEAEYEDGYVHSETELGDRSLYVEGNTFTDILHGHPCEEHGPMVRFSCFYLNQRYDIDWTVLPASARPIRFRHGFSTMDTGTGEIVESGWSGIDFGFQYNDEDGSNQQEVLKVRDPVHGHHAPPVE